MYTVPFTEADRPETGRPAAPRRAALVDGFGREITYVRLSITDRCDLRCVYCMAEDMTFLPRNELLTLADAIYRQEP